MQTKDIVVRYKTVTRSFTLGATSSDGRTSASLSVGGPVGWVPVIVALRAGGCEARAETGFLGRLGRRNGRGPTCGLGYHAAVRTRVVAAVIEREERFLVCQRPAGKRYAGLWEFPGGKFEPGEQAFDAARRELGEELAVTVSAVGEPLLALEDPGSLFTIEFTPVVIEGDPVAVEHASILWASSAELVELPLAPSDARFVMHLRSAGSNQ